MNGQFYGFYNETKDNYLVTREFALQEFHTSGYYKIPFGAKILSIFAISGGASGANGSVAGTNNNASGGTSGNNGGFCYFKFLVEDLGEGNSLYVEIGAGGLPSANIGNPTSIFLDNRSGVLLMRVGAGRTGAATSNYTTKIWQYSLYDSQDITGTRIASTNSSLEIDISGDCSSYISPLPGGSILGSGNIPYNGASLVLGSSDDNDWIIPPIIQNYTAGGKPIIIQGGQTTGDRNGQHAETVPVFTYSMGFPGGGGAASTTANGGNGGNGFKGSGGGGGGAARTGFSAGTGGRGGNGYVAIYPIF